MAADDQDIMNCVFYPSSVAVIGASTDSGKERSWGWVGRLLQFGYKGRIFPINPNADEILGLKAYPSIAEVPYAIDYAIISVPRESVPASAKQCADKEVRVVHIYTAGFSETGTAEGIRLQGEIEAIARNSNTRFIGPNCMGVYCPAGGLSFDIRFPKESGGIAFFSQTGVGGRRFINLATGRGLRFSKVVSYGNGIDLNVTHFWEYALSDPETELIFVYLEGVDDGRHFFNLAKTCARTKPVVLLKAGLSDSGAGVVASHTASMAGSRNVWDGFFKQTGAIPVESLEEAVEQIVALQMLPAVKGKSVGLVGRGGGFGAIATDMCEREGLKVPEFQPETKERLAKITPFEAGSAIRNPVEIGLGLQGVSKHYVEGLRTVAKDPQIDFIITFLNPEDYIHYGISGWVESIVDALREARATVPKAFEVVLLPGTNAEVFETVRQIQHQCQKEGIACFMSMDAAIRAAGKLVRYCAFKETLNS